MDVVKVLLKKSRCMRVKNNYVQTFWNQAGSEGHSQIVMIRWRSVATQWFAGRSPPKKGCAPPRKRAAGRRPPRTSKVTPRCINSHVDGVIMVHASMHAAGCYRQLACNGMYVEKLLVEEVANSMHWTKQEARLTARY